MNIKFTPERALIIGKNAIIADLHLGLENVLIESGFNIPKIQIDDIIERLEKIDGIERIIIAGDLKHEFGKNLPFEWEDVKKLLNYLLDRDLDVVVVRGNHDNYLKAILTKFGIELLDYFNVGEWKIVHGHKECYATKIIMGHEHPAVKVRVDGMYTFHCFLRIKYEGREVIVLPAFSPLVSGSDITSCNFISPILKNVRCEDVEVYAVNDDVYYLGTLEKLRNLLFHQSL